MLKGRSKDDKTRSSTCKKLVPRLFDHNNYCIRYRNLKFIKDLGVEIKTVHNVISFKQKTWLEPYISFNTEKRKQAKKEFEKYFLNY